MRESKDILKLSFCLYLLVIRKSYLIFFVISLTIIGSSEQVFADAMVSVPEGTSVPGCETTNQCFIPYEVKINGGESVIWSNDDSAAHTVTSVNNDGEINGIFDSSLFMAGTVYSHKFENSGTYPYLYHQRSEIWCERLFVLHKNNYDVSSRQSPLINNFP